MVVRSYEDAVPILQRRAQPASSAQERLARISGCSLPSGVPGVVAAAYLRDHLEPQIDGLAECASRPVSARQLTFLRSLTPDQPREPLSLRVASAWIDYFLILRSVAALEELRLEAGDHVARVHVVTDPATGQIHKYEDQLTVSSIGEDGLVYFKGGNGQCAHPHRLRRLG